MRKGDIIFPFHLSPYNFYHCSADQRRQLSNRRNGICEEGWKRVEGLDGEGLEFKSRLPADNLTVNKNLTKQACSQILCKICKGAYLCHKEMPQ